MTRLPDDTPRNLRRLAASFVLAAGLVGLWAGCEDDVLPAPGNTGEVCTRPNDADCDSHTVILGQGGRKLTPEQVAEARRMYAGLLSKREIARHFGVDSKTIAKYLKADR